MVEDVTNVFNKNPDLDIVFGNQLFDYGGNIVIKNQLFKDVREQLARTNVQHQTIFARKKVFVLIGNFSEEYKIVSDWLKLYNKL